MDITGSGTTGNVVEGNYIGTNAAGTAALGNASDGVRILNAVGNTIGGTAAGARNVISGNTLDGIEIDGSTSTGNVIQGNFIGTNAAGTAAVANSSDGISLEGANDTIIGGGAPGAGNLISGNVLYGILIDASFSAGTATGNVVQGNTIGLDVTGTTAVNNNTGVYLFRGASNNLIGTNADGVNDAAEGNVISGNRGYGVHDRGNRDDREYGRRQPDRDKRGRNRSRRERERRGVDPKRGFGQRHRRHDGGARNVISGNAGDGVLITGSGTTGNVVEGNFIGTNAAGNDLLPGEVAWYRAEFNANDSAGGNNGTLEGGVTYAAGEAGQAAFSFNGTNGYVDIPYAPSLSPSTAVTVEAWINPATLPPASSPRAAGTFSIRLPTTITIRFRVRMCPGAPAAISSAS